MTKRVEGLVAKWREQAEVHGVRTFTGNDHALFANELDAALAADRAEAGDGMLPDALVPVSKEWYELCERAPHVDKIKISGELAEAIVAAVCARAASCGGGEPIGWVFQHEDTGRMTFCENDGINTPEVFVRLNPRHTLCGPAYTTPPTPSAGVEVTEEMVTKAARALCKRTAAACNVNEEDSWTMYGQEYKADAFFALTAALEGGK